MSLLFSDKSDNSRNPDNYLVADRKSNDLHVIRAGAGTRVAVIHGNDFQISDYEGSRLSVKIDLDGGYVSVWNPDAKPLTPEEIDMKIVSGEQSTYEVGKPYDVTLEFPVGDLDYRGLLDYVYPTVEVLKAERKAPGSITFTVLSKVVGDDGFIDFGSDIHRKLNVKGPRLLMQTVEPSFVGSVGDKIYVRGRSEDGEINYVLTREADGIYSGIVRSELSKTTAFRIYVPTPSGEVVLGNFMACTDAIKYPDDVVKDEGTSQTYFGSDDGFSRQFILQDVTGSPLAEDKYLGIKDGGTYTLLRVDLNNMKAILVDPGFVPYISVEESEILAKPYEEITINLKSNVASEIYSSLEDDLFDYITCENWCDLAVGNYKLDEEDNEKIILNFNTGQHGEEYETVMHITSPLLKWYGKEAQVKIIVKYKGDVEEVDDRRVNVYSQGTSVTVVGTEEGDTVSVYTADGSLMTSRRSDGSDIRFDLGVRGAFVVTAGSESFKVVL